MLNQLLKWFARAPRTACFHCGDPVYDPVQTLFAGQSRLLCCRGCASVLQAIEQAGQSQTYLDQKASQLRQINQ